MTTSPVIRAIQERLAEDGYVTLPSPITVAGVKFDFTGIMHGRGGRALDLVLFVDTTAGEFGDRDGSRVRQRVEALSRALDVTKSRYVVTVILAGAALRADIEALSQTCRVLNVDDIEFDGDQLKDEAAKARLEDRIRVLLDLNLTDPVEETSAVGGPAMDQLIQALPSYIDPELRDAVIAASPGGEKAVIEAWASLIERRLNTQTEEDQS